MRTSKPLINDLLWKRVLAKKNISLVRMIDLFESAVVSSIVDEHHFCRVHIITVRSTRNVSHQPINRRVSVTDCQLSWQTLVNDHHLDVERNRTGHEHSLATLSRIRDSCHLHERDVESNLACS